MVETQPPYLDLDIWLSQRADGRGYEASTTSEPFFLIRADGLRSLEKLCARELALYAMTEGHDVTFAVRASLRPRSAGTDPEAPPPPGRGARCIGRVVVEDVLAADGTSSLPRGDWAA